MSRLQYSYKRFVSYVRKHIMQNSNKQIVSRLYKLFMSSSLRSRRDPSGACAPNYLEPGRSLPRGIR